MGPPRRADGAADRDRRGLTQVGHKSWTYDKNEVLLTERINNQTKRKRES